jgi:gliding motility-associated-like protein
MKKIYTQVIAICFFLLLFNPLTFAGEPSGWTNKLEPQKVFIQNQGQFNIGAPAGFDPQVQYAYDGGEQNFYFTKSGVVYLLRERVEPNEREKEREEREMKERMKKGMTPEQHQQMEAEERRVIMKKDQLTTQWIGANPNVRMVVDEEVHATYSYCFNDKDGKLINKSAIPAFKKLTYKDLYPNIDVVYEIHKDGGVKYSVVIHPGGDISLVKLKYSKNAHLQSDGNIRTHSRLGNFIDHAPVTFYEDGKGAIASSYTLKNDVVSFSIGNHDAAKTIVIDPWTQTPVFTTQWHSVWECDKDAAGNVYIIGGVSPMQLLKYNAGGTLQWTYSTPYDTSNGDWLGVFAVDNAGNSYVTRGSTASMQKISTAGAMQWNNASPGGLLSNMEFWSISFNCDQSQLVVGGTDGTGTSLGPFIFNMNMGNGSILNSAQVTGSGSLFGFPPRIQEVRAITACGNGNYYYMTHDSIGYIHQGLTSCLPSGSFPFHVNNNYGFDYKCENWRRNNTGIAAMKYFGGFVYTHGGNKVDKRDFYTGAIVASAAIPGGAFTNAGFGGGNYVSNSGIDIDSCGNIYCGSTNAVIKFNSSLTQTGSFATSFNVYDVSITSTGDLIAAGSTGNSTSGARTGYVQSFAAGACQVVAIVCCDASICRHAAVCSTDPAFNFTATTPGGVWSGTGITNTTNGTFNPSVAGVGTFTIYYTLPCGRDSTTITVNSCTSVSLCRNGNGTLTVSGGTAPYTWQTWDSTGQNCVGGAVVFGFCTGTWVNTYGWVTRSTGAATTYTPPAGADTLRVIDNSGTTVTSFNIATLPPCVACALVVSPGTTRNVSCFGGNNGSAHVTATGGTIPYTYAWTGSASTLDSAFNLVQGTYTVTVRDANGCSGTTSFSITQPATAVSAAPVMTQATCGSNTGKVVLHTTGGTPTYTYTWSPNVSTTDSALNLAVATYNVTITDSKGCTFVTSSSVTASAGITVSPGAVRNVSCFGGNNGSAHVTVSGGTIPYTYAWTGSASTVDSAFNLVQGTYTVTVRDANNCSGTATFTLTQPATAVSAAPVMTQATCGNNNGKVVLHATGGTPAYTYTWSPNVSATDSALNLAVATYNVTITDSKGCTFATSSSVTAAAGITVSPGAVRNVSCFGGNNGAAHVTVSGGTIPYTYAWTGSASTVDSAFNLAQGTYTVTVRDANNCSGTASFTITQPATAVSAAPVMTQATCGNNNGKVVLHATGGTPTYTYTWSPNVSTTDSALNLAVATYNMTITDSKGCTFVTSSSVTAAAGITVSPGAVRNVSCFGGNNGAAHVTVSGGTIPYTYAWTGSASTVDSAFNLAQGTYTVTVRDANNCSGTASFTITQPLAALGITNTTVAATCGSNNGKVVFTVTGGTPAYTYLWSPNVSTVDSAINLGVGSYNVTVTDSKGCNITSSGTVISSSGFSVSAGLKTDVSCFGGNNGNAHVLATGGTIPYTYIWSPNVSTTDSAINLIAGTYNVTVHDANNCSGIVSFNIAQPTVLGLTKVATQGSCGNNNGKIQLTVTGGTPAYSYLWSPNVSTNDSAVNLGANTYNVTVTDAKGCIVTASQAITVSPAITVAAGATANVICFGGNNGSAQVTVTGGTIPITYIWSPNVSSTATASNLTAGTYNVTVHDVNNCSGTASFTITQPAAALAATAAVTAATCGNNNGKVVLTVTGGTSAYTYTWSPNVSVVDSAVNLAQGTYDVTVQDANGCNTTVSANVSPLSGVNVTLSSKQNVTCNGGTNGKIFLNVSGGQTPYTYVWSPAVSFNDSAVGLAAGTYDCSVTDNSGCQATISTTITEPLAIGVAVSTTQASCGASNGTATATVTNGAGTLSYLWSAGGSTTSATDNALTAASYTVTVTDANQCTGVGTGAVSNSGAPTATIANQVNENCSGGSTGRIVLSVSGGMPPYTYTWSPNVSTVDSAINLAAGPYAVTVHDATNCIAVVNATITEPPALSSTTQTVNADCGVSNGSAQVNATGGTGSYTYLWSTTQTVNPLTGLAAATYTVTVTDALGCQTTNSATVSVNNGPAAPSISASGPTTFCQGDSVVLTSSAATGNTWSTGATTQSITVFTAGPYTVTQTVSGCTGPPSAATVVTVNPIPAAPTISASGPLAFCAGGSVTLTSSYASGNTWSTGATTQSISVTSAGTYTVSAVVNGCPSPLSAPVAVSILTALQPVITASKPAICPGDSVILDATTASATAYAWSNGASQATITIYTPGSYQVTVTSNGCTGSDSISVGTMAALGTFQLPDSLLLCLGDSVTLDATTANATSYQWAGISSNAPVVTIKADGVYYVTVSNSCGSLTESSTITFNDCDCRIVMPNAFTPNGDGNNDLFGSDFKCDNAKFFDMSIFNRWGERVFQTNDLYGTWDGKYKGVMQEPGVYVYYANFVGLDHGKEKTFKMKGSVTLIR